MLGKLHIFRRGQDVRMFAPKSALDLIDVVFRGKHAQVKRDYHLKEGFSWKGFVIVVASHFRDDA